jgi:hypothetical protein
MGATYPPFKRIAWSGQRGLQGGRLCRSPSKTKLSSFEICCSPGFGSLFIQLSSTSSGISTSIYINSPPMPSCASRCICGFAGLRRSNLPLKVLLRCTRSSHCLRRGGGQHCG